MHTSEHHSVHSHTRQRTTSSLRNISKTWNSSKRKFPTLGLYLTLMSMQKQPSKHASKKGLGACLIQKGKVVCFASQALTKTEQNYQNLEREALGTIWGIETFHYFLYGKEFILETDQKPLMSIYKKHMIDIRPRVQKLIVRTFSYQPLKVVYKKGSQIPVADALPRVTPMDPEDNIKLPIIAVNMITTCVLMTVES